jgi:hypothetical protein
MSVKDQKNQAPVSSAAPGRAVDEFIEKARQIASVTPTPGRGRLVFALDATMSRQPTWDIAQCIQGEMFAQTSALGGLDVQLVYFRGFSECRASKFVSGGQGLGALMSKISCRGGHTQLAKVLRHALSEAKSARLGALVFIGDAMEEHEDTLCALAGELGLLGVKAFMFHEGADARAEATFKEIARLTGGAYAQFDQRSPRRLAELLAAAAAYAVGGRLELERRAERGGGAARLLLSQMG